jgi:hypothetical protein
MELEPADYLLSNAMDCPPCFVKRKSAEQINDVLFGTRVAIAGASVHEGSLDFRTFFIRDEKNP